MDDIGIAANTTEQLNKNIRAVFKCIRKAGLKLTSEKCHFGVTQVEFLGRTITPNEVAPEDHKVTNFPDRRNKSRNTLDSSTTTETQHRDCPKIYLECMNS